MSYTKTFLLVRHCKATGQPPEATLTEEGELQALELAGKLANYPIDRIISSPFVRAQQSAVPLAQRLSLEIALDERLSERVLSTVDLPDWFEQLRATFDDFDLCFEGGESNRMAMQRGVAIIDEILAQSDHNAPPTTVLVTHGNLMALLLHHFDASYGFDTWRNLTNPDVYRVTVADEQASVARAWPH